MVNKILSWAGGGLLTGMLAFTAQAGGPAQSNDAAWQCAQDQWERAAARMAAARERIETRMVAMADRLASRAERLEARAERAFQDPRPAIANWDDDGSQEPPRPAEIRGPAWLGIGMEEVSAEKAKELKLPAERGVLVTNVVEGSPAAKAGLKVNDVITEFDGQRVEGGTALQRMVHEVPPGRSVNLTVWRDGNALSLHVEITSRRSFTRDDGRHIFMTGPDDREFEFEMPQIPPTPVMPAMPPIPALQLGPLSIFGGFGTPMLGIDAEDLSGQLGNYFGAPDGEGILVREAMPGTPAEKAGLKAGDVILRVDGIRVHNAEELRSTLHDKSSKAAGSGSDTDKPAPVTSDLSVLRSGKEITLHVELQPPVHRLRPMRRVAV